VIKSNFAALIDIKNGFTVKFLILEILLLALQKNSKKISLQLYLVTKVTRSSSSNACVMPNWLAETLSFIASVAIHRVANGVILCISPLCWIIDLWICLFSRPVPPTHRFPTHRVPDLHGHLRHGDGLRENRRESVPAFKRQWRAQQVLWHCTVQERHHRGWYCYSTVTLTLHGAGKTLQRLVLLQYCCSDTARRRRHTTEVGTAAVYKIGLLVLVIEQSCCLYQRHVRLKSVFLISFSETWSGCL
jgi:hypothetical protein